MTGRHLSAAELRQRREAAVKSGAYSATKTRPASRRLYERLRRRVVRSTGPTTAVTRLRLSLLATTLARIEHAEAWLAEQPDAVFKDARAGVLHAQHDRLDRWVNTALSIIDKLPEGSAEPLGLSALGTRRR